MRVASTIGKVVIVTGASAGIGAAVAERLSALAERLRAEGGVVDYLATHVGDRGAMQRLADATVAAFGRIDVLVNNAGVMSLSTLAEGDVDAWDQMIDINLKGVLYGIAAVLPVMRRQNSGHIINLSSTMAHGGQSAGAAVYVATKAAVSAISEAFRQEAGPNIRSTIISPGAVTSELHDRIPDPKLRETIKDFYKIAVPASAIADAVLYSISQPAAVDINEIIIRPTAQEM
jgi:NADP-dependent 3-hydroxy acid dehydrogenase YdfG